MDKNLVINYIVQKWVNLTYDGGILYPQTVSKTVWSKERVYFRKVLWTQKLYL